MLKSKNAYSLTTDQRSMKTGQVSGDDKVARVSNMESSALKSIGADNILRELMGPRADSADAKDAMEANIALYGYTSMKDLPNDLEKKQTLVTTNTYLLGAGIESDLLEEDRYYIDADAVKQQSSAKTNQKIDNIDIN